MMDELVMAVPAAGLWERGRFQGLQVGGKAWLEYVFEPRHSRFLPRAQAESDPGWKQVIPYVILSCGEAVFCYRRGQRSTEARLRALHSVGLGGHIRHSDDSLFAAPGWAAYREALRRELREEVELGAAVASERLVGLINDDATEVGRVHIGLVHLLELAAPAVRARESKIAAGRFAPVAELRGERAPAMESWSAFCLKGWEQMQSQSGWTPEA
ncbi:MAG: phosphoesterase [Acidobacteria bacterium]|nr:MAG: phosphoesterase [Acidobacteriota bacterium]